MRQSDFEYIKHELEQIHAMRYDLSGITITHNGGADIDLIEKFYRNSPQYVEMLLKHIRELHNKYALE